MKKEYHLTISRKDRIYLTLFVALLLGWELGKPLFSQWIKKEQPNITGAVITPDNLQTDPPSNTKEMGFSQPNARKKYFKEKTESEFQQTIAAPIDITNADVHDLISIGFQKKTAYNIIKYLDAGGQIYDLKGLMKIYSMDSAQWKSVSPFVIFPEKEKPFTSGETPDSVNAAKKIWIPLRLNHAQAFDLEELPGIGPVLAERIIKYRTSLGGFISVDQLRDCYGISPETFALIQDKVVTGDPVETFSINMIDPATFSHPYLDKKIIRTIQAYIKNHGYIQSEEDLIKVFPPNPLWYKKALPYINYNIPAAPATETSG